VSNILIRIQELPDAKNKHRSQSQVHCVVR